MQKQRRNFSPEFKAKVALEALTERETLSELGKKHQLHSMQISNWKQELKKRAVELFESDKSAKKENDFQEKEALLYQKIDKLEMELDWLKKKLNLL
jgi:transposase